MGKVFNKRLTEEGKKEGLLKSVKNTGDKNEKLLKECKNKNASLNNDKSFDLEKVYNEIEEMDKKIDYRRFVFAGSGKHRYDFSNFLRQKDFVLVKFLAVIFD